MISPSLAPRAIRARVNAVTIAVAIAVAIAIGFAAFPAGAAAQNTSTDTPAGPFVLEIESSAAAGALGGAFPLGAGTADILFYQPGALGSAQGVAAYRASYGGAGSMAAVAGTTSWFGGTIGVGFQSLSHRGSGGLGGTAPFESAIRADLPPGPVETRAESVLSLGFARGVGPVELGVVGKWASTRAGGEQDGQPYVDVGAALDAGPATVALAVRNVGPGMESGASTLDAPVRASLTAASDSKVVGPFDVSAAARLDRTGGGDLVAGGGVEVAWWPIQGRTFAARAGYGHPVPDDPAGGLTLGGSFRGDQFSVHYAYTELDEERGVHRFSLSWR